MPATLEKDENGLMILVGDINAETVVELQKQGEKLFSLEPSVIRLDLKELVSAKSIVLSLLLSWLRYADRMNLTFEIINMPSQLFAMARVSGLEKVLPITQ